MLGTPSSDVLDDFKKKATHMDFDFKETQGCGFEKMIPHVSPQAIGLIRAMLTYTCEDRINPNQALKHPYFSDMKPEGRPTRFLPMPQGLTAAEGDSAAGDPAAKDPLFPPIEKKKIQVVAKVTNKTLETKKKSITLDHKSPLIGKMMVPQYKSPYGGKHFYNSYY